VTAIQVPSRGRTSVSSKALSKVVSAVSADELEVDASSVSVDLSDSSGKLVLTVRSPIRAVALGRIVRDGSLVERAGGTLLARTAQAQDVIRSRVNALTGYAVDRVIVRVTGVEIKQENRVK
jgi:hypothetical protein